MIPRFHKGAVEWLECAPRLLELGSLQSNGIVDDTAWKGDVLAERGRVNLGGFPT